MVRTPGAQIRAMTTSTPRAPSIALALGGALFIAGGMNHPGDSGEGSKVEQLHEMLVQPSWYPSHTLLLFGMAGFAFGAFSMRQRLPERFGWVARTVWVISAIALVGMVVHLLEGLNAPHIADGQSNAFSQLMAVNESVVDTSWALGFSALAVIGGLTRTVGNVVTAALGLVGGLAFALASATIAWTDRFDMLFPLGGLLGLWAIVIGVTGLWQRAVPSTIASSRNRVVRSGVRGS